MKTKNFDQKFDDDVDITPALSVKKARRVLQEQLSANLEFPASIAESFDREDNKVTNLVKES